MKRALFAVMLLSSGFAVPAMAQSPPPANSGPADVHTGYPTGNGAVALPPIPTGTPPATTPATSPATGANGASTAAVPGTATGGSGAGSGTATGNSGTRATTGSSGAG